MAGSENAGVEAASADLFEGAVWAITPTEQTRSGSLVLLRKFVKGMGSRVVELSPEEHDLAVAAVSHLPHVTAAALVNSVSELTNVNPGVIELAAGGYHDTTRIAASLPGLWRDICFANKEAIVRAIRQMTYQLSEMERALVSDDARKFEQILTKAHEVRSHQKRGSS